MGNLLTLLQKQLGNERAASEKAWGTKGVIKNFGICKNL